MVVLGGVVSYERGTHVFQNCPEPWNRSVRGKCGWQVHMAPMRHSMPDSGLGFQAKVLKPFQVVPSLGRGVPPTRPVRETMHEVP